MRANEGLERAVVNFDGRKRKDTGLAESSRNRVILEVLDLNIFFAPVFFFATCPSFFVATCPITIHTHTHNRVLLEVLDVNFLIINLFITEIVYY